MPQFRLLDSYSRMQQRPFGTNTALSNGTQHGAGGSFGSALRRQESAYGQALRILNRQARRGDANAALKAIDVRDRAMEQGYSPGILRNISEKQGDIYGRIGAMEQNRRDSDVVRRLALKQAQEELGGVQEMANNGTKVAQNTTVSPGMSGNAPVRVQGASGVQGATALSAIGTPAKPGASSLPANVNSQVEFGAKGVQGAATALNPAPTQPQSRMARGWDRFKSGVSGAVDALTGKIPDVEPPKAQAPTGKIDGRPAQEVLKEMRDRREQELGELPQYAPPKAIMVPEPVVGNTKPVVSGPPASAAAFPGPAGPPSSAAPFPGVAGPPASAARFPGVSGPPSSAVPPPEIVGPPESPRGSRILERRAPESRLNALNKSAALAFSNMERPKAAPLEMAGPPDSAKSNPVTQPAPQPKVTGVGEMIEDSAAAARKKLAESANAAEKWITSGAGKPEGFRKVTKSDIAKGEANDAAWRQYRDMVKRQGNTPTYEGFAAWKRSQK